MNRVILSLALSFGIAGCAAPHAYTFEGSSVSDANQRASRYCGAQGNDARLEGIERDENAPPIAVYRCIPSARPR